MFLGFCLRALFSVLASSSLAMASAYGSVDGLVVIGSDTVRVEIADEHAERVQGLKNRTSLPDGTGMLFVFQEAEEMSFWMVDTLIDLDIAFIDADFRIFRIATMKAGSSDETDSMGATMFALEVRAGWFAEKEVRAGDRIELLLGSPEGSPSRQARIPGGSL